MKNLDKFINRFKSRRINYYPCVKKDFKDTLMKLINEFISDDRFNSLGYIDSKMLEGIKINEIINKKDEIKLKKPLNNILKFNDYNEYIDLIREFTMVDIFIVQANGITTGGEILFQDEIGNKIAGVVFGPQRVIILCDSSNIYDDVDEFLDQRKGNVFSIIYGSMEGHKDRVYLIHIMEKI